MSKYLFLKQNILVVIFKQTIDQINNNNFYFFACIPNLRNSFTIFNIRNNLNLHFYFFIHICIIYIHVFVTENSIEVLVYIIPVQLNFNFSEVLFLRSIKQFLKNITKKN